MARKPEENSHPRLVELTDSADRDQAAIYTYTAQQWGVNQAEGYLDFLEMVMRDLAENPTIGRGLPEFAGVRCYAAIWKNSRHGHTIFYKETELGISVIRILHTAMNWQKYLN